MSLTTSQKFGKAMDKIGLNLGYLYIGEPPETEEIFLKNFQRTVGIEKLDDGTEVAKMSSDPNDFGVTWTQVKAEMDKL
jgi:hypothetical protein